MPMWWMLAAVVLAAAAPIRDARAQDGSNAPPAQSTLKGVFTDPQATRGDNLHRTACGTCHNAGAYSGVSFQNTWIGRTVFDLFDRIKTTMPSDNPGVLSRQQYADITAYVLKLNGFPSGSGELSTEDEPLKHIRIDPKPSPTR
jgi:S-disulfanyl-L-cysteine oxidoreductase SoxD